MIMLSHPVPVKTLPDTFRYTSSHQSNNQLHPKIRYQSNLMLTVLQVQSSFAKQHEANLILRVITRVTIQGLLGQCITMHKTRPGASFPPVLQGTQQPRDDQFGSV